MTLRVALTGGVGSGKTTVCMLFTGHGVPVIDADEIARECVQPGQPALEEITRAFGPGMIDNERRIDRARLRSLVFSDRERRRQLEQILHPRIAQAIAHRVADITAPYCVVCIPLLIETRQSGAYDRVVVVDSPIARQIERVMARDRLSRAEVEAIIAVQASREARLAAADETITNDGDLAGLARAVLALHRRFLREAETGYAGR
ncbi:MAG: dephospho-CoA kinase [Gammaproteobacteria bacterium]